MKEYHWNDLDGRLKETFVLENSVFDKHSHGQFNADGAKTK